MRRFVLVIATCALAACKLKGFGASDGGTPSIVSTLASLVAFEGRIDMSMTVGGGAVPPMAMTTSFEVKGMKMRTETKGVVGVVSIADMDQKKSWLIDDAGRTYTEIDLGKASASAPSAKSTAKAKNLGKSDTVAGYSCELWEVTDATMRTDLCVASGLSMMALGLSGPLRMFTAGGDAWTEVLSRGFPLRMVMLDSTGVMMMKMEATRIEKKSIPDSDFAIPAGYTKMPSPI